MQCCRFKEAVNECTSALDKCTPAIPAYHKALVRRAKAYEQMGHFKQALSDIQKANKADTANPETQAGSPPEPLPPCDEPSHHGIICGHCARHAPGSRVTVTKRWSAHVHVL